MLPLSTYELSWMEAARGLLPLTGTEPMSIEPELIVRLQQNDHEAQRIFWSTQFPYVFAICAHILGKGEEANELAVDILHAFIFHYVKSLEHPGTAKAYLRLMAVRRALSRRKEQRSFTEVQNWESVPGLASSSAEEQALYRASMPRLEHCLSRLSGKARQVLRLSYTQGVHNTHIAELLGVSKQYIGKLIKKSLEHLRRCMEEAKTGDDRPGESA